MVDNFDDQNTFEPDILNEKSELVSLDDENSSIIEMKGKLVKNYYKNEENTLKRKIFECDGSSIEGAINSVLSEIVNESDDLLSNKLIFTRENRLHDATTVSVKRTEVLEKIANIISKKYDIIAKSNAIDLNSPVFQVFQQICVDKLKEALISLDIEDDLKQLIVIKWGDKMTDWEKELKSRVSNLNIKFL